MVWNLSEKPHEFFGYDQKEGDLALELEVEGFDLPAIKTKMWTSHTDGSLKVGGVEYVHNGPKKKEEVLESLKNWEDRVKKSGARVITSDRTSVHVHKNMQKYNLKQIVQGAVAYYMLEPALMKHCGATRKGNLFCLPMEDGKAVTDALHCLSKGEVQRMNMDSFRYASLNLGALKKFGSLEVRTMRGQYEAEFLDQWAQNINRLFETAAEQFKAPSDILDHYYGRSYKDYLGTFLSSDFVDTLVSYRGWDDKPDRNHVSLAGVCYDNDWDRKDVEKTPYTETINSWGNAARTTPRLAVRDRPQWSEWMLTDQANTMDNEAVRDLRNEVLLRLETWYGAVWERYCLGLNNRPMDDIDSYIAGRFHGTRNKVRTSLETGNPQTKSEVYDLRDDAWVDRSGAALAMANHFEEEWRLYAIPNPER